ncbi:MAG: Na+/H+ antiporter subunit E [Bacillota bacterium]|nr:Na+/H+ antiporter subunit E [Bacillota bacterium]
MNIFFTLFYTIIWIIFSENFNIEIVFIGLISSSFIAYTNSSFLDFKIPKLKFRYFILFFEYLFILIIEIIKANIHVALIILNPKPNLDSTIITHKTNLKSDFHKMILANSITLTPGTLTINLEEDVLKVHCLKKDFKKGVENSKFEKILLKIEEKYYD